MSYGITSMNLGSSSGRLDSHYVLIPMHLTLLNKKLPFRGDKRRDTFSVMEGVADTTPSESQSCRRLEAKTPTVSDTLARHSENLIPTRPAQISFLQVAVGLEMTV